MTTRSHLSPKHRAARSRLVKLLDGGMLLKGSLVTMARTCGKPKCKCQRGHKHVSLYLSVRLGRTRKMLYVPRQLEPTVRGWVQTYRQAQRLMDDISQACVERFVRTKQALAGEKAKRTKGGPAR